MPLYSVRLPIGWTCLKKKKGIKVQRRPFKKTVPLPSTTWWLTNLFVKNLNFRWGRFLFKQRPYQHVAVGFAPSRPGCLWHFGHLDRVSIWLPPLLTPYRCFYRVLERIFFFLLRLWSFSPQQRAFLTWFVNTNTKLFTIYTARDRRPRR